MKIGEIICGILLMALAVGAFVISYFQFKEKGYLFNNAYLWSSKEKRKGMDEDPACKRPHYRQSGVVFALIGLAFLLDALYVATGWTWMYVGFWVSLAIVLVYAVVSSVHIERAKKE